jgi:hypothetical protein
MPSVSRLLVTLVVASLGCLPRGAPPAGRQIIADRQSTLSGVLAPTGDGVLRIFVMRPGSQSGAADLYLVSVDADGTPTEQLLLTDIDGTFGLGCQYGVAPCPAIYSRGVWPYQITSGGTMLVDVLAGRVQELAFRPVFWPDGQRFYVQPSSGPLTVYDLDGQVTTELDDVVAQQFFGDDLYYLTSAGILMDLPSSGPAKQVAQGLTDCSEAPIPNCVAFWGQLTSDGVALFLERTTASGDQQWSLRDPLTGAETVLPSDYRLSPDARWLIDLSDSVDGRFTFTNRRDGTTTVVEIADSFPGPITYGHLSWRPGTSQVWMTGGTTDAPVVWIIEPGKPPVSLAGSRLDGQGPLLGSDAFTADGAYWFSATPVPDTAMSAPVQVGSADAPGGPRIDLNTSDERLERYAFLPDDRMVFAVYTLLDDYQERMDVNLIDPGAGTTRLLGERGRVAAVGLTRMMGMFHVREERGDLTVVDLDTNQSTVLAPECTMAAFAEQQGADPLAPGTRIAYQFQARDTSPYDGIWIVESP